MRRKCSWAHPPRCSLQAQTCDWQCLGPAVSASLPAECHLHQVTSLTATRRWRTAQLKAGLPCWLRWWRIRLQGRRPRSDPWVEKIPGEGNGCPLQYSCLESPRTEEPGRLRSMGPQTVRELSSGLLLKILPYKITVSYNKMLPLRH